MSTRRTAKAAEAIREVVSSTILFELRDPRVRQVTVLSVEVPTDMRTAKVHVSVLGTEAEQKLCLHGLNSSRGFLQRRIADRLDLRWTPVLSFVLDDGVKKSIEAARILRELAAEASAAESPERSDRQDDSDAEQDALSDDLSSADAPSPAARRPESRSVDEPTDSDAEPTASDVEQSDQQTVEQIVESSVEPTDEEHSAHGEVEDGLEDEVDPQCGGDGRGDDGKTAAPNA